MKGRKGKQRIAIELIEDKTRRQVTFSKRRNNGLFKKAGELSTLSGAQVVVLTFSNAGKPYCCGPPNVDDLIRRFARHAYGDDDDDTDSNSRQQQQQYHHNNKANESVTRGSYGGGGQCWWDQPVDGLGLVELEKFKVELEGLRGQVASKLENNGNNTTTSRGVGVAHDQQSAVVKDDDDVPQAFDLGSVVDIEDDLGFILNDDGVPEGFGDQTWKNDDDDEEELSGEALLDMLLSSY